VRISISDLWRWAGPLDRAPYLAWGAGLALLKYTADRFVVQAAIGRTWSPSNYWVPGDVFGMLGSDPDRAVAFWPLVAVAMPFVWIGVILTLRRLRSAGLPGGLVILFFVPVLNLFLFALLLALPTRATAGVEEGEGRWRARLLDRWLPRGAVGCALASLAINVPLAALLAVFGAGGLGEYGWGLFLGLPFVVGVSGSLVYGYREQRSLAGCAGVASLAMALLAGVLWVLALEGLICILMAAPIAMPIAWMGSFVGWVLNGGSEPLARDKVSRALAALFAASTALMGAESAAGRVPGLREVRTAVDIAAPPDAVWRHVVAFAEIPPPREKMFKAGIAYPIRARIDGAGPGATRRCEFSTGAFVEPIEVWDEPRLLKFGVASQPPIMTEMMLWPGLQPPHVDQYLLARGGQFRLTPLPSGVGTRLEGTTWYTHRIWPEAYWGIWSDSIIHRIHERVLEHIRREAEAP
jgi:hypothetical protein